MIALPLTIGHFWTYIRHKVACPSSSNRRDRLVKWYFSCTTWAIIGKQNTHKLRMTSLVHVYKFDLFNLQDGRRMIGNVLSVIKITSVTAE